MIVSSFSCFKPDICLLACRRCNVQSFEEYNAFDRQTDIQTDRRLRLCLYIVVLSVVLILFYTSFNFSLV